MKKNVFNFVFMLVMALVFGMTVVGCSNDTNGINDDRTNVSVTVSVTASASGEIYITHNGGITIGTSSINVTTGLAAPNDSFTLVHGGSNSSRSITGLPANQVVEVTLTAFTREISPSVSGHTVFIFVSDL